MSAKGPPVKVVGISPERVENVVLLLRGQKVILDFHLAALYGVETKVLNQAVRRNEERFPEDFMFRLDWEESRQVLRSQIVTLNSGIATVPPRNRNSSRSQIVTLNEDAARSRGRNIKYRPLAFTEQGVAMLSSVLRSPRAVQVNIEIMRAFVRLRQWMASNVELARKLAALEKKYDQQFKIVFDAIRELMDDSIPVKPVHGREIGFHAIAAQTGPQRKRRATKNLS